MHTSTLTHRHKASHIASQTEPDSEGEVGQPERCKAWTHLSMLMAHRFRMLAVHIMTSRVTKMSQ